ncbi:hypothetical protein [Spiroplasma endosymbiont of 'Nebria riversi']|uniref:hypothetical protein n=1 Tax=Spiroplasma endosymbiont of 'Nebria riversi' TaxID=2792084 RepID=UPI001C03CABD|nr:hypothetical protein [Spiroplasma endosymbiont of 'Nebria riversi']
MENKHFYWLKALRQKYSYKELITALKAINCQLKEKSLQCEFKRIENYCKRKTKKNLWLSKLLCATSKMN